MLIYFSSLTLNIHQIKSAPLIPEQHFPPRLVQFNPVNFGIVGDLAERVSKDEILHADGLEVQQVGQPLDLVVAAEFALVNADTEILSMIKPL